MGKFILGDCMDLETGLPSYPDNFFDLAIVDPPYGINARTKKEATPGAMGI
jgi:tRNA G10  N-methylase Trm11